MRYIFIIIILMPLICGCIASSKALQETNQNVLASAKHDQLQDKLIGLTGKKVFGDTFIPVDTALKNSSNVIANQAEETALKEVGLFNFEAIKNTVVTLMKNYGQIALDLISSTPYGPMITAGAGIVTALLGKGSLDGFLSRRKEKVKKEILKRQNPDDAKKFDDLVLSVEKEIKDGKIKV